MKVTTKKQQALDVMVFEYPRFYAEILLQGAQLMCFKPSVSANTKITENWLWHSQTVSYQQDKAVRGGIPICWPIFNQYASNPAEVQVSFDADMPKHGIARTALFNYINTQTNTSNSKIESHTAHFQLAQHIKGLSLDVYFTFMVADDLKVQIQLVTKNHSNNPMSFTQALHTYLSTADIEQTSIDGFDKSRYTDTLLPISSASPKSHQASDLIQKDAVKFTQEVDRIYHQAGQSQNTQTNANNQTNDNQINNSKQIVCHTPTHRYQLDSVGSHSTVIWNPWINKAKTLDQFLPNDYQNMFCVETANVMDDFVTLAPQAQKTLSLVISQQTKKEKTKNSQ